MEQKKSMKSTSSITLKKLKVSLKENPNLNTIRRIVEAFSCAVGCVDDETGENKNSSSVVKGSTGFNEIIQVCITDLVPAIYKTLKLPVKTFNHLDKPKLNLAKSRMWKKLVVTIKTYLLSMLQLLNSVTEPSNSVIILKHILQLIPFYLKFLQISRLLLKKMVKLWCTSEETIRVLAFLSIFRVCRSLPSEYLDYTLKQMYMAYVRNCKFTSQSTWPLINFMKRSLVEVYTLEQEIAYQHAFIYIRQLVIHLRNAITVKKKDAFQAVYNWQYIHCLLLWIHLLSSVYPSDIMRPLIYPVVQTAVGTVKLIPTARYLPLRFHIISALIKLSRDTRTFIPILPLILEVLDIVNFNKKHTSLSMKPLEMSSILKLSKSQLQQNSFKDCVIDKVYNLLLEYLHIQSSHIGFPELVLPAVIQLKTFLRMCRIGNCGRQVKQILEKIEEQSKFISNRRKTALFNISDIEQVKVWENQLKEESSPLDDFYCNWKKIREKNSINVFSQKEQESLFHLKNKSSVKKTQNVVKDPEEIAGASSYCQSDSIFKKKTKFVDNCINVKQLKKRSALKKKASPFKQSVSTSAKKAKLDDDIVEELKLSSSDEEYESERNIHSDTGS